MDDVLEEVPGKCVCKCKEHGQQPNVLGDYAALPRLQHLSAKGWWTLQMCPRPSWLPALQR